MEVTNNFNINITEESLNKSNDIISKMESHTFHNHYHILYDLCTSLNKKDIIFYRNKFSMQNLTKNLYKKIINYGQKFLLVQRYSSIYS